MIAGIDNKYPCLSGLVQKYGGCKLEELAERAHRQENVFFGSNRTWPLEKSYLGLGDCCYTVIQGMKRMSSCDEHSYVATVEEFIKEFANRGLNQKKLWHDKICPSEKNRNSSFLDTVVEAAWAVHFLNSGNTIIPEKPFDPLNKKSKDADIFVVLDDKEFWLDARSVDLRGYIPICRTRPTMPKDLPEKLWYKAKEKYNDKFKKAVASGTLKGSSVGVLLAVLKAEADVMPFSWQIESSPPARLFGDTPGLDVVLIHTLRREQNCESDVLKPYPLVQWESDCVHNVKFT